MAEIRINGEIDAVVPVGISKLGTAIYDNIQFPEGQWTDVDGNAQTYPSFRLDAVTLRVNRRKDIVKTNRAGANGTIKEYISFDDFQIEVVGIVTPQAIDLPNAEPVAELEKFAKLEKAETSVSIISKLLNNYFNVTHVVVEDFGMARIGANSWQITMQLISDNPIDLKDFG